MKFDDEKDDYEIRKKFQRSNASEEVKKNKAMFDQLIAKRKITGSLKNTDMNT